MKKAIAPIEWRPCRHLSILLAARSAKWWAELATTRKSRSASLDVVNNHADNAPQRVTEVRFEFKAGIAPKRAECHFGVVIRPMQPNVLARPADEFRS